MYQEKQHSRTEAGIKMGAFKDSGGVGDCLGNILKKQPENLPSQNHHYQGGLVQEASPMSDDSQESSQSCGLVQEGVSRVKLNSNSKTIKKKNKPNPRRNTIKTAANYPRRKLKSLGVDVKRLKKYRHLSVYLQICFLHLMHRLKKEDFHLFMQKYRRWLQKKSEEKQSLQDHVSKPYIQDFKLAEQASYLFEKKDLLASIKKYFGTGKQIKYLGKRIIDYIEEVRLLFEKKNFYFPIPELQELNRINERSLPRLQKIMKEVQNLQKNENQIDGYFF